MWQAPAAAKNEEIVLGLLLLYPEHRKKVIGEELLSEDNFFTELGKRIFRYVKDSYINGNNTLSDVNEAFTDDEVGRITKMKLSRMELHGNGEEILLDAVDGLKRAVEKKSMLKNDSLEALSQLINKKRMQNS